MSRKVLWKVLEGSRKVRKKPPRKVESTRDSTSMAGQPQWGRSPKWTPPQGAGHPPHGRWNSHLQWEGKFPTIWKVLVSGLIRRLGHQHLGSTYIQRAKGRGPATQKPQAWPPPIVAGHPLSPNPSAPLLHHIPHAQRSSAGFLHRHRHHAVVLSDSRGATTSAARWNGEVDVVFINNRTCDRVRRCCPFVAPEPIVIKIFYALLQAASDRLPQQQEPHLVGFGISSRVRLDNPLVATVFQIASWLGLRVRRRKIFVFYATLSYSGIRAVSMHRWLHEQNTMVCGR